MQRPNKKGQTIPMGFETLMFMAVAVVVTVIIIAFGADFVENQAENLYDSTVNATQSVGYNATQTGLESLEDLANGTQDVTSVGIIWIVLMILVSLVGIFAFMKMKR